MEENKATYRIVELMDFKTALLDSYKKLNLKEDEVIVILIIDMLNNKGNTLVSNDMIVTKTNYSPQEVDSIVAGLLAKGYIDYDFSGGRSLTTLQPLKKALTKIIEDEVDKEKARRQNSKLEKRVANAYNMLEGYMGRLLSPIEKETIVSWIDAKYTDEQIRNACLNMKNRFTTFSVNDVSKELRVMRRKDDIQKEGTSTVTDVSDNDIQATLRLFQEKFNSDD